MNYQLNAEDINEENISRSLYLEEQKYMSPGLQEVAQLAQLTIRRGRGCWLEDMDGKKYLDFMAGAAVASLGHSHPKYVKALQRQLEDSFVGSFTSESRL
jgi:4-aminobutyrate aminotransferase-like enzyme